MTSKKISGVLKGNFFKVMLLKCEISLKISLKGPLKKKLGNPALDQS